MRKIIVVLLVLGLLTNLSICVSAGEMAAQPVIGTDNSQSPIPVIPPIQTREPKFNISQLSPNSRKIIVECTVNQGVTELFITTASWYPSMPIEIGFEHQTTGTRYKVDFTQEEFNGTIRDFTITTPYVPSGSYYVYIKNNGAMSIGGGTFGYELTG